MKKIFSIALAALSLLAVTSCYDTMDSKSSIDKKFEDATQLTSVGVTLVSAKATAFNTAAFSATLEDVTNVIDAGFQVSTNAEFTGDVLTFAYEIIEEEEGDEVVEEGAEEEEGEEGEGDGEEAGEETPAPEEESDDEPVVFPNQIDVEATGLEGETTYYVRAYAATPAGTVLSEVKEFTTPVVPIFGVAGLYTIQEYSLNDDDVWEPDGGPYKILIEQDEDDETTLYITNFFGFGGTVEGFYEEEEETIYISSGSVIGTYGSYGNVMIRGVNDEFTAYTKYVYIAFQPLGGAVQSGIYYVYVSAGPFGYYMFDGVHDNEAAPEEESSEGPVRPKFAVRKTYRPFDNYRLLR